MRACLQHDYGDRRCRNGTYGQLSAEDGQRYSYWTKEVRNGRVQVGQMIEFQMWEGQPIDIFARADAGPATRAASVLPAAADGRRAAPRVTRRAVLCRRAHRRPIATRRVPADAYWIELFTSPSGRISRRQFWLHGVLPIVVASIVLGWIPVIGQIHVAGVLLGQHLHRASSASTIWAIPAGGACVYLVPMLAAAAADRASASS